MMLNTAEKLIESTKALKRKICEYVGRNVNFSDIPDEDMVMIKLSFEMMDHSLELLREQADVLDKMTLQLESIRNDIKQLNTTK